MVFNRASPSDVLRYGSSSGTSQRTNSLNQGRVQYAPLPAAARLGPLAQAVASFAPSVSPNAAAAADAAPPPSGSNASQS